MNMVISIFLVSRSPKNAFGPKPIFIESGEGSSGGNSFLLITLLDMHSCVCVIQKSPRKSIKSHDITIF